MNWETMCEIVSFVMNKCDQYSGNALADAGLGCKTADEITDAILADASIGRLIEQA